MTVSSEVNRVLVTGGGGFLGAWILRLLHQRGITAQIFDLREDREQIEALAPEAVCNVDWITGDVSDTSAVVEAARDCDAIIHLAGLMTPACQADPLLGARVNVIGTLNVFEAAKANGIARVVYTSSGGVYGPEDNQPPFPATHYGVFKLANEGSARAYWLEDRISSFGFRPFVIYGPGRDAGLTADITFACAAAARGGPYKVGLSGPIALVYVEDVAFAYVQALLTERPGAHTVNLRGQLTTVEEAVDLICVLVPGARIEAAGGPIPSSSTAVDEWETCRIALPTAHTLRQGLEKTIAFYRA